MIKKIHIIKQLGVFNDFNWNRNSTLLEFCNKNVIYGWNYSGKTTLSRIFSSLRDKVIHVDYSDCYFNLTLEDGSEFESNNIENSTLKVAVFNKEYIDSKLSWNSSARLGEPIAFDVGENVTIRSEILELQNKIDKVILRKEKHQPDIDKFTEFDNWRFTEKSKEISVLVFGAERQFNKRNFTTVLNNFDKSYDFYIIYDEKHIEKIKKNSVATNTYEEKANIIFSPTFTSLYDEVKKLLHESPTKDVVIEILEKNKLLYDWAKQGLDFNENKEKCAFCGNDVDDDRLKELNSYFSNASKALRDKISILREKINTEIKEIRTLSIPTSKHEFIESVRNDIETKKNEFKFVSDKYIYTLKELISELDRKEDGNIFTKTEIKTIPTKENEINTWLSQTNELIKTHSNFVKNFKDIRDDARDELQNHLVALYLKEEKYLEKQTKKNRAENYIDLYNKVIRKYDQLKNEKINSLKTITKGKEELNKFIRKFLNREDIRIEVTTDDMFILQRGVKPASNLSEGEKTAIAFSYFLVYLESLGIEELRQTIVYIDDPISSLDNNHIAQVYSLINSFFFRKEIDTDIPEKVINCFSQLFLSTHNFEFFSFLKDSTRLNKKNDPCHYYYIKKLNNENSDIVPLPKSLSKYKSEYIYLFELIYNYYKSNEDCNESDDILIPNALRRFLEIYTLMKIPSEPDSVENRINELVDDVNQFKLLNHFSHFTTFEKLTKHDELLMILPEACKELFKLLEHDETHYNSLKKSIGV
jgi:wobble nucleotide-excising tRNase